MVTELLLSSNSGPPPSEAGGDGECGPNEEAENMEDVGESGEVGSFSLVGLAVAVVDEALGGASVVGKGSWVAEG